MAEKIIDLTEISNPANSGDLYGEAIRRLFSESKLKGKTRFLATVLTNPSPLDPLSVGNIAASGGITGIIGSLISAAAGDQKVAFKARIVDEDSPHEFLADPCSAIETTSADATNLALSLIQAHTTFISESEKIDPPKVGDLVWVELKRLDDDKYDLSQGLYIGLFQKTDGGKPAEESKSESCAPFLQQFNEEGAASLSSFSTGEDINLGPDAGLADQIYARLAKEFPDKIPPPGKCGSPSAGYPIEDCKTGKIGDYTVTLHPLFFSHIEKIYNDVKAQNLGEDFFVGSHIRSIKEQIQLRISNCGSSDYEVIAKASSSTCKPPTAPPGSSRHNLGLAVDFGGILLKPGLTEAQEPGSIARNSKTFAWMMANVHKNPNYGNVTNYSAEPWHWSADGR